MRGRMTNRTRLAAGALACFAHAASLAQEVPAVGPMMRGSDALSMPSLGRVVLALLVTIAVAFAAVLALKRFQYRFGVGAAGAGAIRVVEKMQLGTCRVYLLNIEGSRVLLTEKGNAIATTVLPPVATDGSTSS
jgi:flagellar biogenesis protein FliO